MQRIIASIPNSITIFRMVIALIIGVLVFIAHDLRIVQALVVVGILSDKLDGALARLWNVESERGKQLESIADPLFNLIAGIYIITQLEFPMVYFWIAIGMLLVTVLGRMVVKLTTGKFFYEKSQVTRVGTLLSFAVILFYLFALPYRYGVVVGATVYGIVVTINYIRMMMRFIQRERNTATS